MTWVTILAGIISIAQALTEFLRDRRIIDAATAETTLKGLRESDEAIKRAKAARDLVRAEHERDPDSVHRDDGHRRD